MRYLELATQEAHEHYIVEAKWPKSEFGEPSNHIPPERTKWGRYNSSAWNDLRRPNTKCGPHWGCRGSFDAENPDVADVLTRVGKPTFGVPVFTCAEAAFAYAERLAEFGECAARYSYGGTQEGRDLEYAGRKIHTRVVRQVKRLTEWEVVR